MLNSREWRSPLALQMIHLFSDSYTNSYNSVYLKKKQMFFMSLKKKFRTVYELCKKRTIEWVKNRQRKRQVSIYSEIARARVTMVEFSHYLWSCRQLMAKKVREEMINFTQSSIREEIGFFGFWPGLVAKGGQGLGNYIATPCEPRMLFKQDSYCCRTEIHRLSPCNLHN